MRFVVSLALLCVAVSAHADFVLVTNPAELDIQTYSVSNPFDDRPRFEAPHPEGGFFYVNTNAFAVAGTQGVEFTGSFSPGEEIFYTPFVTDGGFTFSNYARTRDVFLSGLGIQIQSMQLGTFSVELQGFSRRSQSWETFYIDDLPSSASGDDSAPFIGLKTTDGSFDLASIHFEVYVDFGQGPELAKYAYSAPIVSGVVPEPSCLLALGFLATRLLRR